MIKGPLLYDITLIRGLHLGWCTLSSLFYRLLSLKISFDHVSCTCQPIPKDLSLRRVELTDSRDSWILFLHQQAILIFFFQYIWRLHLLSCDLLLVWSWDHLVPYLWIGIRGSLPLSPLYAWEQRMSLFLRFLHLDLSGAKIHTSLLKKKGGWIFLLSTILFDPHH